MESPPKAAGTFGSLAGQELIMPAAVVGILALMLLPLPPLLVDCLIALNITLSLLMLLTAIQVQRPLEFSVFPTLLLITTLFRLALNVSTTRLILLGGAGGTDAAGEIVKTFGNFIVGGSYLVGIVVFLILTLINFVVISKGSGRIAEVSARFTLDALPGKQMSIDSDLAAGLVTQDEARRRRETLAQETDFHGAMDGASKFVRGDAIAGLIITAINIIGGLLAGVLEYDLSVSEAAGTYTILTIGDALASQLPALLISTAAGVVITRVSEERSLGGQVSAQLFRRPRALLASAGILAGIGLMPGMPLLPFFALAGLLTVLARRPESSSTVAAPLGEAPPPTDEEQIARLLPVEPLELQVGYGLVSLVDARHGGEVVGRIASLRKNIAQELGLILPPVHVRDNLELAPGEYRLLVHGVETARGTVMPDRLMAMDPGDVRHPVDGVATLEPAFGLPALWIRQVQRAQAEAAGYTVVEPATVIVTHVGEALRREAHQVMGRDELQQLLDVIGSRTPKLVEELIPSVLTHAELLAVLRGLLREQVCIRDLRSVFEALSDAARFGKGVPFLVDQVRARLGAAIVQSLLAPDGRLHVALLDAPSEDTLRAAIVRNEQDAALSLDLGTAQTLVQELQRATEALQTAGATPCLLAPADLRHPLWQFSHRFLPQLHVVSQRELPSRVQLVTEATLTLPRGRIAQSRPVTMPQGQAAVAGAR